MDRPPLVVVGYAARDLVADDPRGWRLGGSVSFVSLTAARLGIPVRALVGVDGESAAADELRLLDEAGVERVSLVLPSAPVFRNVETDHGREQECLAVGRPLRPRDLPRGWRDARAWALVPLLGELRGAQWAELPRRDALVAVGWQGLLREAIAGGRTRPRPPLPDPLLVRADVTLASDDDLPGFAARVGRQTADRLAPLFPRPGQQLLLTRADRGGRLYRRSASGWIGYGYEAAPARVVRDATGAGDVYLGAVVAATIDPALPGGGGSGRRALRERLRFAAVVAALSIEGPGITAIPTRDVALERFAALD